VTQASEPQEPTREEAEGSQTPASPSPESQSMQEYYGLQKELFTATLALTAIIFVSVWMFYNLNIALNYLIGACTGVVYLRMLGKDVERISTEQRQLSKGRFALFIGMIIVASQWNQLQIVPIFLGFLTYKAAIIVYMLRTLQT
jgi:ATP synthase protein I